MSFNPQFSKIGEVLVHNGVATKQQVKEALDKQKHFRIKLGENAVEIRLHSGKRPFNSFTSTIRLSDSVGKSAFGFGSGSH